MAAFIPKRRSTGHGITRTLAAMADVRTPAEALAFLLCTALFLGLGWMITHPREFYAAVMGVFS